MYSNKDLITLNEVQNDGKTIHLYFNTEVGLYVAYGFSAFFASHIVSELKLSCIKHQHDHHEYYKLELKNEIPLDDYSRWANSTKWEK